MLLRKFQFATVAVSCLLSPAFASEGELPSLTADFGYRDSLPESDLPTSKWYGNRRLNSWGPHQAIYPPVEVPAGCDPVQWKRARIVAVAKKYIGLPYRHHHIPAWSPEEGPGLDCSNFTAWVYNYGLGIKFNSDVHKQAEGRLAPGRVLNAGEAFEPGDLLYILKADRSKISHVVIFIDADHIIDSHAGSVQVREFAGWYKTHLALARRVIE